MTKLEKAVIEAAKAKFHSKNIDPRAGNTRICEINVAFDNAVKALLEAEKRCKVCHQIQYHKMDCNDGRKIE